MCNDALGWPRRPPPPPGTVLTNRSESGLTVAIAFTALRLRVGWNRHPRESRAAEKLAVPNRGRLAEGNKMGRLTGATKSMTLWSCLSPPPSLRGIGTRRRTHYREGDRERSRMRLVDLM